MVKKVVKYFVDNIGFIALVVLAVGLGVPIIYHTIIEILGSYGIRVPLALIDRSSAIVGGIGGGIGSVIVVLHMNKKTDFSG